MNALYAGVAALDMTAVGPSRTTSWSEWVGNETEIQCGHCHAIVLPTDYFCHHCGRGVKPRPCLHPAPGKHWNDLPDPERPVEPVLIVETDQLQWQVMRVECPECHRKSTPKPRSYFAIAEWNEMEPYPPPEKK